MSENEVRNAIAEYLLYQGYLVIRVNSGVARPKRADGTRGFIPFNRWQVQGENPQTAGVFDLLCFRDFEPPLAVDAKVPGNTLTEAQRRFMVEWIKHGGIAVVATSIEDLQRVLAQ